MDAVWIKYCRRGDDVCLNGFIGLQPTLGKGYMGRWMILKMAEWEDEYEPTLGKNVQCCDFWKGVLNEYVE